MPKDWPHDDREQVKKAREAAEALFKPRQQVMRTVAPVAAPSAPPSIEQQARRTPLVIALPARTPVRDQKVETPMAEPMMVEPKSKRVVTKRRTPKIVASEFGRIRMLAEYGMTLAQLAENYEVSMAEIERIVVSAKEDGGSVAQTAE